MPETLCETNGIELCYETFGDPADPALLMIMGLGTQMIAWHDALCAQLAERGFHVVRYDNRDCGRSSSIDGRRPTRRQLAMRSKRAASYDLDDMAGDAAGLLDVLGIESAHVLGASMGGMIAQTLAATRPARVRSLTSIMSNTGSWRTGQPSLAAYRALLVQPPRERAAFIEHAVATFHVIGSPGFPRDDDELRDLIGRSFDRGINAAGTSRQLAAIAASGDRTPRLRTISVPTTVIHGSADRLVAPSGGHATARAIPGARLLMIEGMGHDLPRGAWPPIIDAVAANAARDVAPAVVVAS